MEQKIIEILKRVVEHENVDNNSNQTNCENWDSLHQLNLIVELEDEFDVSLEPEEIADMTSVANIIKVLNTKYSK